MTSRIQSASSQLIYLRILILSPHLCLTFQVCMLFRVLDSDSAWWWFKVDLDFLTKRIYIPEPPDPHFSSGYSPFTRTHFLCSRACYWCQECKRLYPDCAAPSEAHLMSPPSAFLPNLTFLGLNKWKSVGAKSGDFPAHCYHCCLRQISHM